jgi:protein SFI1
VEERLRSDTGASLDHDYVCPNNVLLQALERRADKQISRQEGSLVRAVLRVWKAHERGHLLERVQHARVLREAWETWKRRLRRQGDLEGSLPLFHRLVLFMLVISYRARLCSAFPSPCHFFRTSNLAKALRHATRGASFAVQYANAQLQFRVLFKWRVQLRAHLKHFRQAKYRR